MLSHPADAEGWKSFDSQFTNFSLEALNVRLGLASDGFNPFGVKSISYSCWSVALSVYNLPPKMCLGDSIILSTLIHGSSSPGQNIDVYLQPLVDELLDLWQGVDVYDASTNESFKMRVVLLWTINDFPTYGMLSGWCVHDVKQCPVCNSETDLIWLRNSKKYCFTGSRRFLELDHEFRFNKEAFNGQEEHRLAPTAPSGATVLQQKEQIQDFNASRTWKKKSIFFRLPYCETHLLRHNLDITHIEKNVYDNVGSTLLNSEKSKDNLNARLDLKDWGIREELHPVERGSGQRLCLPPAPYIMSRSEKKTLCKFLHDLKVPDGYACNISRCVNVEQCKINGLKSHDCHILMQRVLSVALREIHNKHLFINVGVN